jgi:hypothetical protein
MDPDVDEMKIMEFTGVEALEDWIKWHQRGLLSVVRPNKPPLVFKPSEYNSLDPEALYSIASTESHTQALLATKHNRIFDKAFENRCRLRLGEWFVEQGIYVVEQERIVWTTAGSGAVPAAEWDGAWRSPDGTTYLLECKFNISIVYSALLCRL